MGDFVSEAMLRLVGLFCDFITDEERLSCVIEEQLCLGGA